MTGKSSPPENSIPPAEDIASAYGEKTRLVPVKQSAGDEASGADATQISAVPPKTSQPSSVEPTMIGERANDTDIQHGPVPEGTLINNNYRITQLVSAGGMGEVYRAENLFTGDPVAVKVILPGLARDESVLDMFRREARVLVQLRDDAIVRYHNFVLDHVLQRYCLIMEFVEGQHLGSRIKAEGPFSDEEALALLRRLASGLSRAHSRGVTHRDLSPDNVILRDDHIAEAVLIDFGIARSTELGDGLHGRFAGKFKYIAPEQLGHWDGSVGPWTDVYGLALLVAMVVRGSPLDMGDSVVAASAARLAIPDLSGISHRLFPLLQYMLEPDPKRRVRDMPAVLRLLDDPMAMPANYRLPLWSAGVESEQSQTLTDGRGSASGSLSLGATSSESPFSPVQPVAITVEKQRRNFLPAIAAGAVVLFAMAGVSFWLLREGPAPQTTLTDPAPAMHMVPRDMATREGFLAAQSIGQCTFARRAIYGPNAGMIEVFSDQPVDTALVEEAYSQEFGVSPAVVTRMIAPEQCAVTDFLREVAGRPAPVPVLTTDVMSTDEGFSLRGSVQSQGRNLWLFIVNPAGEVYDLTGQVQSDNRFAVAIRSPESAAPFMLIAFTTDAPLISVTAAPAGADAATLMPKILQELDRKGEAPATDIALFGRDN